MSEIGAIPDLTTEHMYLSVFRFVPIFLHTQ